MAARKGPPLFVLIADEDAAVRETFTAVAQAEGLEVTAVPTFQHATEESDSFQKLDILIADWALPDGSGLDLAAHVHKKHAACQVVLLGESGSLKLANELYGGGVADFLRKPLPRGKDLTKRLRRAVFAAEREGKAVGVTVSTSIVVPPGSQEADLKSFDGDAVPTIIVASLAPTPVPPTEEQRQEAKGSTADQPQPPSSQTDVGPPDDEPEELDDGDLEMLDDGDLEMLDDDDVEPLTANEADATKAEEEAAAKKKAEEEAAAKKKAEEEAAAKKKAEEEAASKRDEERARKKAEADKARRAEDKKRDQVFAEALAAADKAAEPIGDDADTNVVTRPPELDFEDASLDLDSPDIASAFKMTFRSIPDFAPVEEEGEDVDADTETSLAPLAPEQASEEEQAIDAEAETASPDVDFQVSISEPRVVVPEKKEHTAVFGAAGTTPMPPKAVRDSAWANEVQATGIFDPSLTQAVWSTKLGYGTGGYFGLKGSSQEGEEPYYEIEREIARGRNATIYLARWPGEEGSVALKVLSPTLSDDVRFRQRFRREIRSNAALRHDNIIKVHRYGRQGGSYYMALELMKGSLRDVLTAAGPLPTAVVALLMKDLLKGINYAHRRGVIHRDLKPENLMFGYEGVLKIGDFHFAKLELDPNQSTPGVRVGTAPYFSPEQARGQKLDVRSDLFTVGTIIYEMVAGKNPFDRGNDTDSMSAVSRLDLEPLDAVVPTVHPLIADVVHQLLAPTPEERYATGNQVLEELMPLFRAVYKRYPEIRRQFAKSPPALAPQLIEDEAKLEVRHARRLLEQGPDYARRAAIAAHRALLLQPGQEEAEEIMRVLHRKHSFSTEEPGGAEVNDALTTLERRPGDKNALRTLADRARKKRNVFATFAYLRRYVRAAPEDKKAAGELADLKGRNRYAPFVKDQPDVGASVDASL